MSAFDQYINGRKIGDGMKCPVCDGQLLAEVITVNPGELDYRTGRGGLMDAVQVGFPTIDLDVRCMGCNASLDIRGSYATLEVRTEPSEPLEWEYVIMAISSVKYGRVKNLGDYQSERMEAEYVLEGGETPEQGLAEVKRFVKAQLGLGPSEDELEAARQLLSEAGEL